MGFMQGKRVLIVGLASNRSIAWGIAQAMHREGAELAFTFQNEKLQSRVEEMADQCGSKIILECDVSIDEHIDSVFSKLGEHWAWPVIVLLHGALLKLCIVKVPS